MTEPIKIFSSPACPPCIEVEERIRDGKIDGTPVEIVNVETDEGFADMMSTLERCGSDTIEVPSAFHNGRQCEIRVLEDSVKMLNCP